jgi:hypothetical protein
VDRKPAIRGRAALDFLDYLEGARPGARARVLARIPEPERSQIVNCPKAGWIPFECDHHIPTGLIAELGRSDAEAVWRASLSQIVRSPLLNGLLELMIKLSGLSMHSAVKMYCRGFEAAYRDVAVPRIAAARDREVVLQLDDVTPMIAQYPDYLVTFQAIMGGLFDLVGQRHGRLDFSYQPDRARIVATFTW